MHCISVVKVTDIDFRRLTGSVMWRKLGSDSKNLVVQEGKTLVVNLINSTCAKILNTSRTHNKHKLSETVTHTLILTLA